MSTCCWRVYICARINCIDSMLAAMSTPSQTSALSRSASIHASPAATNATKNSAQAVGNAPNAAQPSTQTAPLQHPHPHPCGSSDRCLICLTRPDDFEDLARGMTCGMCSACGTFFCGFASASVAASSPRPIDPKRRRVQAPAREKSMRRGRRPRPEGARLGRLPGLSRAIAGVALRERQKT